MTSEQDFRIGTEFHPERPGRPPELTSYYKTEHLKFSGRSDDALSSYRHQYERLLRTHHIGEEDAVLIIHAMLKRPGIKFYQERIKHRYNNVRDTLDRIQAHYDTPAMREGPMQNTLQLFTVYTNLTAFLMQTLCTVCVNVWLSFTIRYQHIFVDPNRS